jgi:hypothetical protein
VKDRNKKNNARIVIIIRHFQMINTPIIRKVMFDIDTTVGIVDGVAAESNVE